jgi:peptide/nickel transport system substrate-binding protein
MRGKLQRFIGLGLVAVMLAACGGDDDADRTDTAPAASQSSDGVATDETAADGTSTDETATASTSSEDTTPVADADLNPDATLRFGYPFALANIDPHTQGSAALQPAIFLSYDRLVHLSPDGEFLPGLAESWEVEEDGGALLLHLRPGVTFHDGTPFDGEAVRANIERGQTVEASTVAPALADIEQVEVVDAATVRLHLASTTALTLLAQLSGYAGCMISPTAFESDLTQVPVGAGMYKIIENRQEFATYERFADYWNPADVGAAKFEYRAIADDLTRWNALRTGEIDATVITATQLYAEFEPAGFNAVIGPTLEYANWWINQSYAPLENVKVRQALMHAIDRQAIAESVFGGYAQPTVQQFPEGARGHVPELTPDTYEFDPELAKEMLAEAGVDPAQLKLRLAVASGLQTYTLLAEVLQAQMADIGVEVEIMQLGAELSQVVFVNKATETFLSYWTGRPDPVMTLKARSTAGEYLNPGDGTTPRMEELVASAEAATDPADREEIVADAVRESIEQVLEIPIVFPELALVSSKDVVGLEFYITAKPEFRGVGIAAAG